MEEFITNFDTTAELEAFSATTEFKMPHVALTKDTGKVHYILPHDYSQDYFTMVVTASGSIKWSGSTTTNTLYYSKDNGKNWSAVTSIGISVNAGDKVLWKGITTPRYGEGIGWFSGNTNVRYSIEGNAMSILYGDEFKGQTSLEGKNYALYGLLHNSANVTSAKNLSLPATTLATSCYGNMFYGCTSLTTAPELPATTLANSCYFYMFYGCTSLTTAPSVLSATTLALSCYSCMFFNCASLTTAPELPATTLAIRCYSSMFKNCTSLNFIKCLSTNISAEDCTSSWVEGVAENGTFTKAASMSESTWGRGTNGIPSGWTVVDA